MRSGSSNKPDLPEGVGRYFAYMYTQSVPRSVSKRLTTGEEAVRNLWRESDGLIVNITAAGQPQWKDKIFFASS
jgi:hypothetical protein